MSDFLERYNIKISALSPIYIGDGKNINKKMYIYLPYKNTILIPDEAKMYSDIRNMGKEKLFSEYILGDKKIGLTGWLAANNVDSSMYTRWTRYILNTQDIEFDTLKNTKSISTFIKDEYGNPYIPGSCLKGMLRTALLSAEICKNPSEFADIKELMKAELKEKKQPKSFLSGSTNKMEIKAFHKLGISDIDTNNALNSVMSGLIVSDSRPIDPLNLILCQKVDYNAIGKEKKLNLLREALRPGTEVFFSITIDKTKCPYSINDIISAINLFQSIGNRHFYKKFGREEKGKNIVWLGGGVGFLSKTVIYALFEGDGVNVTDQIFKNNLSEKYREHKHQYDVSIDLSPHVCKCTRYKGKLYNMGVGRLEII